MSEWPPKDLTPFIDRMTHDIAELVEAADMTVIPPTLSDWDWYAAVGTRAPSAVRMDVGGGVLDYLAAHFTAPPPPDPMPRGGPRSAVRHCWGLPIVEVEDMQPGEWVMVDHLNRVVARGRVS